MWRGRVALGLVVALLVYLFVQQLEIVRAIGQGLSKTADPFSESNAIRAAQHYAEYGFFRDAGLPHVTYGTRFPTQGWVVILPYSPLPNGVYTRYPPLPDLLCGLYEVVLGASHRQAWRMVPVLLTLASLGGAFALLRRVFAPLIASLFVVALGVAPAFRTHMHGLHFQGYAHALLTLQLALLTSYILSRDTLDRRRLGVVFGLAMLQGFLSFEYLFVVTFAPLAIALLASARVDVTWRDAGKLALASFLGFVTAHVLHFAQVIAFYRGLGPALQDFRTRAQFRFTGPNQTGYAGQVVDALEVYVEELWSPDHWRHFGPHLPLLTAGALVALLVRKDRTALVRGFAGLVAGYGVCFLWIVAMPSHSGIHPHIVPRIFFLAYFAAALLIALQTARRPGASATG